MLSVGRQLVTEIWVGTNPVGVVQTVGMEVWPNKPVPPWFKTFIDHAYHWLNGAWMAPAPDLSDKPSPVKGSIVFSTEILAGSLTLSVVVFDGTRWVESIQSFSQMSWTVNLRGSSDYSLGKWWNSPTAATDFDNWQSDPMNHMTGQSFVCAYAAPDGIHIRIADQIGSNPRDFVEPYPTGVTQSDMPATADL